MADSPVKHHSLSKSPFGILIFAAYLGFVASGASRADFLHVSRMKVAARIPYRWLWLRDVP
jgi:hypothetical protein